MSEVFDTLAAAFRPDSSPVIRDIYASEGKYGYVVTCEIENSGKPRKVFHINKHDLHDWLEDERPEWLEWQVDKPHPLTGEHVQAVGRISAEHYAAEDMRETDWHEYLIAHNLTTFPYDPE